MKQPEAARQASASWRRFLTPLPGAKIQPDPLQWSWYNRGGDYSPPNGGYKRRTFYPANLTPIFSEAHQTTRANGFGGRNASAPARKSCGRAGGAAENNCG